MVWGLTWGVGLRLGVRVFSSFLKVDLKFGAGWGVSHSGLDAACRIWLGDIAPKGLKGTRC